MSGGLTNDNYLVNGLVPVGQQTIQYINQQWPKVTDAILQGHSERQIAQNDIF